ncbi:gluconate 2-dehydrogenase subunit 3 family protein [Akkermansiaceae bacterium]|nr:gluconate 2-dehydrogenase subunit 3 family protein [Akkermansiaceae bacterium]
MMDRRELLKMIATTVGGTVALPESAFARLGEPLEATDLNYFSDAQRAQTAMIAEAIIPKTDTPGAIEAGVPGWIEVIVKDCFPPENQQIILDGLADLTMRCQKAHGKSIAELSPEDQVAFLTQYQKDTQGERWKRSKKAGWQPAVFIDQFKDLVKVCYCSSEVGATQAFEYHLVPGKWVADMPLEPGQKAWAI